MPTVKEKIIKGIQDIDNEELLDFYQGEDVKDSFKLIQKQIEQLGM